MHSASIAQTFAVPTEGDYERPKGGHNYGRQGTDRRKNDDPRKLTH